MHELQGAIKSPAEGVILLVDETILKNDISQDIQNKEYEYKDKSPFFLDRPGTICFVISAFIILFNLFLWGYLDMKEREYNH